MLVHFNYLIWFQCNQIKEVYPFPSKFSLLASFDYFQCISNSFILYCLVACCLQTTHNPFGIIKLYCTGLCSFRWPSGVVAHGRGHSARILACTNSIRAPSIPFGSDSMDAVRPCRTANRSHWPVTILVLFTGHFMAIALWFLSYPISILFWPYRYTGAQ